MKIADTKDTMSAIYLDAVKIRNAVFVKEQGVPQKLEIDENEAYAIHFVLYNDDKQPVATVRLLPLADNQVKVQRMAVLKEFRGKHYGQQILLAAEDFARKQQITKIQLGAVVSAVPFYESLGFSAYGPEFIDAGRPHRHMEKTL